MKAIRDKLLVVGVAALCLIVFEASRPAAAQTYLDEYRAYNAALETGDTDAAARHGHAAWQAAEAELGDDGLTAILAYNYGQLVLFSDAENAVKALRRAEALRAEGIADLPASELKLSLAFTEFDASGEKRRQSRILRNALNATEADGMATSSRSAIIWLRLARGDLTKSRYEKAIESAQRAEEMISTAIPDDYRRKAQAILIGGIAHLSPLPRSIKDVQMAHDEFIRAIRLFPPQKNLDNFDPILAQLLAWNAGADAALYSLRQKEYPNHKTKSRDDRAAEPIQIFEERKKSFDECNIEWAKRKKPKYPNDALDDGYIGAAVVGYELGDDLSVHNVKLLAEVPADYFSKYAIKSMMDWRLKSPPPNDPACRENLTTNFVFSIRQ